MSLKEIVIQINNHTGEWKNGQLVQDARTFLWAKYDPNGDLIYPTIINWGDLLGAAIENEGYELLSKDEVLSILFGLIYRNRIVEGLWCSMFERGVIQQLLKRLLTFESNRAD